jgi:hypothetical protein
LKFVELKPADFLPAELKLAELQLLKEDKEGRKIKEVWFGSLLISWCDALCSADRAV